MPEGELPARALELVKRLATGPTLAYGEYPDRVDRPMLNTAGGVPIVSAKGRSDMADLIALSARNVDQPPTLESVAARIRWLIHPSNHHLITDELVRLRLAFYSDEQTRAAAPLVMKMLPRHDEFLIPLERIECETLLLWTRDNPIHDLETAAHSGGKGRTYLLA